MFTLKIKNNRGEIYELTHNRRQYSILDITGLTLPQCNVNMISSAGQDGGEYSSSHLNPRNIVITLALEGDIETNRQLLYTIFPPHSPVTVYYQTFNRDLYIDGYLEIIDGSLFAQRETMQISIICPDPYFRSRYLATARAENGVYSIRNGGDVPVGFVAEITVSTEEEPSLNYTTTQSESGAYLGDHAFCVLPGPFDGEYYYDDVDLATETFNIYVNGNLKTASDGVTRDLLTNSDGHNYLYVQSTNGGLANSNIGVEHIVDETQNVTDMRYFESSTITGTTHNGNYSKDITVPSWYDFSKNKITFDQTNFQITVTEIRKIQNEDGTYNVTFNFYNEDFPTSHQVITISGKLHIFGSVSGVDVHADTITCDGATSGWAVGMYTKYILSPTLPTYDSSKDILRVYKGDTLLQSDGYGFQTVTKSDGTTVTLFSVSSGTIDRQITFEAISSQDSTDIRDYTQEQIDTAMRLVDGLTITNTASGEYMAFPNYQFKNGDVLSISTVSGSMDVKVTNAGVEKSLLAEVFNNGSFFKLEPGKNTIQITADTNSGYVSGTFSAEILYGGV